MIVVGINDNLVIASVSKSDKGSLEIVFKEAGGSATSVAPSGGVVDIFGSLNDTSEGSSFDLKYIHWPYKMDEYTKTPQDLLAAMKQSKEFLNHILKQYMTEDKIKWNIMAGINLDTDPTKAMQQLIQEAVIAKVYDNQIMQFIGMMAPLVGAQSSPLRVKCTRQSKTKHYASLPRFAPFLEPMTVVQSASRLKFSAYEIKNGLNNGDKVDVTEVAPDAIPAATTDVADSLFS